MQLAPIILFVYNRPEHTRKTIEALQRNPLAAESDLVIFSDGPRRESDRRRIREVREFLKSISGFRRVSVRESDVNRGLADSIIEGVTSVVNEYGRVIVLEDDLVVSPYFLSYMNDALTYYADVERVMHISGYWYPIEEAEMPETFFLPLPSSWGWATWARAWRCFEKNPKELRNSFSRDDITQFNLDGANDFWEQVIHNLNGKATTWAIFWYAAIFRRNGLCLYPSQSAVKNIGNDGTGVHCLITDKYDSGLANSRVSQFQEMIAEDKVALDYLKRFYVRNHIGKLKRFLEATKIRLKKYVRS